MPSTKTRNPLPAVVVRLGWVSFFTDAASEMLYPLIPLFLTASVKAGGLGAPIAALGLIEGMADGLSTGLKAVSGLIADRFRRHRLMVGLGYGLSAMAKPLLAVAPAWGWVAGLRAADRLGKGIRGVPRDLMISEATPAAEHGRAFGFHRMMDTSGAVLGPLVAAAALLVLGSTHLRPVFVLALVPGVASLLCLRRLPRSDADPGARKWERAKLPWRGRFGWYALALVVFGLGNSSDAFLLLRARSLGLSTISVILAYALYNVVYAALSIPAGERADRTSKAKVFGVGLVVFAFVYLGLALIHTKLLIWPLFAVYGVYMAFTDGISRALVIELVPASVRGRALGVTQALLGGAILFAGITAGLLWDQVSPSAPFFLGSATAVAAVALLGLGARLAPASDPSLVVES